MVGTAQSAKIFHREVQGDVAFIYNYKVCRCTRERERGGEKRESSARIRIHESSRRIVHRRSPLSCLVRSDSLLKSKACSTSDSQLLAVVLPRTLTPSLLTCGGKGCAARGKGSSEAACLVLSQPYCIPSNVNNCVYLLIHPSRYSINHYTHKQAIVQPIISLE